MTRLQRLLTLVDGLDDKGPDYAAVREAQHLAHEIREEATK
jgi:hypothetical protein